MKTPILILTTMVVGAVCFSQDSRLGYLGRQRRSTLEQASKCTPGSTFNHDDGCNICFCDEQGHVACTAKGCIKPGSELYKKLQTSNVENLGLRQRRQVQQPECTPGTTFKDADDCNTCYCDEQGRAACTQKLCIKKDSEHYQKIQKARESSGQRQRRQVEKPECTPGTTFRDADDCNNCFCTEDGRAACTQKACIKLGSELYQMLQKARESSGQRQRRQVEKPECTPGTTFRDADDCNDCFCTEHGRAACTERACVPNFEKAQP